MAKCRPSKWLIPWVLLGGGLPWLAAAWISGPSLKAGILSRANTALSGNEATAWAKAEGNGRDLIVTGTSPSQEAADAAVNAVSGTYGVRTAMASPHLKIAPPPAPVPLAEAPAAPEEPVAPAAPPLAPAAVPAGAKWPFAITGTWPEAPGATLKATVGSRIYELGRGAALTSDGNGNFTFAPAAKLPPGTYDVEFTANDTAGVTSTAKLTGAIVIPEPVVPAPAPAPEPVSAPASAPAAPATEVAATPPAEPTVEVPAVSAPVAEASAAPEPAPDLELTPPTVEKQLDLTGLPIIKGTWPEKSAAGLTVGLGAKTYTLGKDANLSSREGVWSLIPSASLKDGIYDVVVTATDSGGKSVKDEGVAEVEVDAVPPDAPALTAYSGEGSPPSIAGTWSEQLSSNLKVSIPSANLVADLGAAASPLKSDGGGNWTLALPAPLPPGSYDVEVTSTDNRGRVQSITAAGGIVVAEAKPAAPTPPAAPPPPPKIGLAVTQPPADAVWPYAITGRWSEGTALNLEAKLAGRTYELGRGAALISDGQGVFTFAPRAASLEPGTYTVLFSSKGPAGDTREASATITIPPKVEPVPPPEPAEPVEPVTEQPAQPIIAERTFDCEATLNTLNKVFPVRFGFDKANLEGIASLSLSQYAALLKDPRCATMKVEIAGHADYYGPAIYNQGLSERRAEAVLTALKEAGVTDSRLSTKGYGEKNPLDPANTIAARQKNRRVEFMVVK
jgi:outer membrane protein OmpA-like peptidoglycan-associated protein